MRPFANFGNRNPLFDPPIPPSIIDRRKTTPASPTSPAGGGGIVKAKNKPIHRLKTVLSNIDLDRWSINKSDMLINIWFVLLCLRLSLGKRKR